MHGATQLTTLLANGDRLPEATRPAEDIQLYGLAAGGELVPVYITALGIVRTPKPAKVSISFLSRPNRVD